MGFEPTPSCFICNNPIKATRSWWEIGRVERRVPKEAGLQPADGTLHPLSPILVHEVGFEPTQAKPGGLQPLDLSKERLVLTLAPFGAKLGVETGNRTQDPQIHSLICTDQYTISTIAAALFDHHRGHWPIVQRLPQSPDTWWVLLESNQLLRLFRPL